MISNYLKSLILDSKTYLFVVYNFFWLHFNGEKFLILYLKLLLFYIFNLCIHCILIKWYRILIFYISIIYCLTNVISNHILVLNHIWMRSYFVSLILDTTTAFILRSMKRLLASLELINAPLIINQTVTSLLILSY